MVEENNMNSSMVISASDNELEEVVIPNSENTPDDDELDDVIPCDFVAEEQMIQDNFIDFSNDGFYDDVGYTSTVSVEQMVDISSDVGEKSDFELDEEKISYSEEDSEDGGLGDIVSM